MTGPNAGAPLEARVGGNGYGAGRGAGTVMLPEVDKAGFTPIDLPKPGRSPWAAVKIVAAIAAVAAAGVAWSAGYRPPMLLAANRPHYRLIEIDRGDVDLFVVENGTIESSNNTTMRCEVEALVGTVGGSQATSGKSGSSSSSGQSGNSSGQTSGGSSSGTSKSKTSSKKSSSTAKGGSSSASKSSGTSGSSSSTSTTSASSGTSRSGSSGASGASGASGSSGSSGGSSGSSGSSSSASTSTDTSASGALSKPTLRSFSYMVTPYTPARSSASGAQGGSSSSGQSSSGKSGSQGKGGGSSKGGGRGGRGGGGRGGGEEEKPGSTRIVTIKPEGTQVHAGDIVAQLDRSSYEEEERTQKIRHLQAKAYVDQARSMLEVAEITLREYRDGIYPQDLSLIRQYIESCEVARERAAANAKWSTEMEALGYRAKSQANADRLSLQQTEIALREANGMLERLSKYTGPKIIKSLEANVQAIKADLLTQEGAFTLEDQRLKRIQKNLEHCTIRAPGDGIVVYANQSNAWGRVTDVIDEGVTVRENQPLFNLPDPKRMRVRARINESKFPLVREGQTVQILVDAYPDRPLKGIVGEVTPIAIPLMGSDVRIYYANVEIVEGFSDLRPGLSAEVIIQVERRAQVTRVPIEAIRWVEGKAFVAVDLGRGERDQGASWEWRRIEVGLSDPSFIEVVSGVEPGTRIIAEPAALPEPTPAG